MVAAFLNQYFYPRLMEQRIISSFRRESDKWQQLDGIDVEVMMGDAALLIDEKAATQYTNSNLPTFAFELSQRIKSGEVVDGWLLNSALKT